jgi:hypothetical protein
VTSSIRLLCLTGLLGLAGGCDSRPLGRMCEVLPGGGDARGSDAETIINDRALECRTQLCLQQSPVTSTAHEVDTAALCTADCSRDSDCRDAELRDPGRSGDRRCRTGFYCGVPLSTGAVAPCRRLCLCRDFGDVRTLPAALTCTGN